MCSTLIKMLLSYDPTQDLRVKSPANGERVSAVSIFVHTVCAEVYDDDSSSVSHKGA